MTWRPRVDVRADLKRIHRGNRTGAMSRDVGYSSITMGEGALELRATDSDADVRVILGDQPDERFGIGLWHRGGLQYLPDIITSAEDRISSAEAKDATQDHRLDAVTDLAQTSRDRLDANDTKNATQDHRLDAATTLGESNRDRIGDVEGKNATQDHRLDAVTSAVEAATSKNSSQDDAISSARALAQQALNAANGAASPGDVDNVRSAVQTLQTRVQQIETWLSRNTDYPNNNA